MKKLVYVFLFGTLASCMQLQPFTRNERFIKQQVQKIKPNEGSISTQFSIYKGTLSSLEPDVDYVEINGYTGPEGKRVVIGYAVKSDFVAQGNAIVYKYKVDHITLNEGEINTLIQKLPELLAAIPKTKRVYEETVYSDYRINSDLVISVKLSGLYSTKNTTIDFWVKGERIAISVYQQQTIIDKLKLFMSR